jgi:hypothetical protein
MTDLGNGRAGSQTVAVPTPSCIRPRRMPAEQAATGAARGAGPAVGPAAGGTACAVNPPSPSVSAAITLRARESGRGAAREALDAALAGVALADADKKFLGRLAQWDKRNAASVSSLLRRVRQVGRDEAAIRPRQLETVLAALGDAARYRGSGAAATGCWDCENIPGGRCADHAKDNDRARAYAELAAALSADAGRDGLPEPRDLSGYRHRHPVAS